MKGLFALILPALILIGCGENQSESQQDFNEERVIAVCENMISGFQSVLKQELMKAMAEGGPENAITVCNTKAPMVADSFSQMPGFQIRRVSLRQRNRQFMPDSFEIAALEKFEASGIAQEQSFGGLTFDSADVRQYRYLKEIKTGELCLKCHGINPDTFSDELKSVLAGHYPDDPAVGYNAGESRGAFSITITFPEADETMNMHKGEEGY